MDRARTEWLTTLPTLRCTNREPGGRPTIWLAGTRESEPVAKKVHDNSHGGIRGSQANNSEFVRKCPIGWCQQQMCVHAQSSCKTCVVPDRRNNVRQPQDAHEMGQDNGGPQTTYTQSTSTWESVPRRVGWSTPGPEPSCSCSTLGCWPGGRSGCHPPSTPWQLTGYGEQHAPAAPIAGAGWHPRRSALRQYDAPVARTPRRPWGAPLLEREGRKYEGQSSGRRKASLRIARDGDQNETAPWRQAPGPRWELRERLLGGVRTGVSQAITGVQRPDCAATCCGARLSGPQRVHPPPGWTRSRTTRGDQMRCICGRWDWGTTSGNRSMGRGDASPAPHAQLLGRRFQ